MLYLTIGISLWGLSSCVRPDPEDGISLRGSQTAVSSGGSGSNNPLPIPTRPPDYIGTPTPDPPHPVASSSGQSIVSHIVTVGETLGFIAQLYETPLDQLVAVNNLDESDVLFVGQQISVPIPPPSPGPRFKIIPDSELVYGPSAKGFDVRAVANGYDGFLLRYEEEVEGELLAGPEIVSLVAHRFRVNPRLLLALLEFRSGWVTQADGVATQRPLNNNNPNVLGLHEQLGWAANQLNLGYYGRAEANIVTLLLNDGTRIGYAAEINHGTAAVQRLMGQTNQSYGGWLDEVGPNGFFATYTALFGNPFSYTFEPLLPNGLTQPQFELPWANEETWFFTGGPHGGWASGAAWAALDFAAPGEQLGCVPTDAWVRAVSDGMVTRSDFGAVVVDMDGDNYAGTGWSILYLHIATHERVPVGQFVKAGDPIGHPSCEGGFSNGTHLHLGRTYNGRWIAADGSIPFNLEGWESQGFGQEYNGLLVRGNVVKEACQCREEVNSIPGN